MNGHVLSYAKSAHRNVQELLPWYLSGQLDEDQRAAIDAHLRDCEACRLDLQWQRRMVEAYVHDDAPAADMEHALAALRGRLERREAPLARWLAGPLRAMGALLRRHAAYVLAAQFAAIAALAWTLAAREAAPADYRTLSAPLAGGAPATLVVVFDPALREQDVRRIVRGARARIVGGPTDGGAYLLAVQAPGQDGALRELRAQPGVRMAESLRGLQAP